MEVIPIRVPSAFGRKVLQGLTERDPDRDLIHSTARYESVPSR